MTAELTPGSVHKDVANALDEDVGAGDLTAGLVDESALTGAQVIAREPMIIAGRPWFCLLYTSDAADDSSVV